MNSKNKIIGFTSLVGDLLHAGHISMLEEAHKQCDYLIVGLIIDPTDREGKNKPIQSTFERWTQLKAVKYIDELIPLDGENDLLDALLVIMPDVRFVGEEYKNIDHTGKNIEGIKIIYNKRRHSFSSTSLRKRVENAKV